jgi:glycosyltransferase involved in cell wall biosynthesis
MPPRVSIVIAMHNAAATVAQALQSLQSQTEPSWEAIVVDDGSTDGCGSIVREAARVDSRITVLQQANAGPAAARNTALDRCRGDFIGFLDADDWLEPDALTTLLATINSGPHNAACGRCRFSDQNGQPVEWTPSPSLPADIGLKELFTSEVFAIHAQLIRRAAIGNTRFRTHFDCYEDADFYLRLAEQGLRWRTCGKVVCTYRQRPRNRGTPEFAARFNTIRTVFTDSYHRIRALKPLPRDFDASETALNRLLFERALTYANMMILQDPTPHKDLAASVLSTLDGPNQISPELAARAAHGYLPWSESREIADWPRHIGRYAAALGSWWQRCIADGHAGPDLADRAIPLLARLIANELDIPGRLLRQLDLARPITLLGCGRNGSRMAHALASRGVSFGIRDDRADNCAELVSLSAGRARVINPDDPYAPDAQHVMTLLDDSAYLKKLPRGLTCFRWADHVNAAAREIHDQLREATHQPGDPEWAHAHTH